MIIKSIFYKKINPGDLWNIERASGTVSGGGGQTYINYGDISQVDMERFLNVAGVDMFTNEVEITAKSIFDLKASAIIAFKGRAGRSDYSILRQHKERHPAWESKVGFPTAPSTATGAKDITNVDTLVIFILRTDNDEFIAGYINDMTPTVDCKTLNLFPELSRLFKDSNPKMSAGIIEFSDIPFGSIPEFLKDNQDIPEEIYKVGNMLRNTTNILFTGAPGTGKTYTLQWLWKNIQHNNPSCKRILKLVNTGGIQGVLGIKNPLYKVFEGMTDLRKEWLTFHQSFNYEEFILSRIPEPSSTFVKLQPKAGVLLDMILDINDSGQGKCGIIFIDELNRGNVSKIFGQLITFLDNDKRGWNKDGTDNEYKLPIPLPELVIDTTCSPIQTEEVMRMNGSKQRIDVPLYFPYQIYIIATMNSVDKSIQTLDSALNRRFDKIEFRTDYDMLCKVFKISKSEIVKKNFDGTNILEIAVRLLYRVNQFVIGYLGSEYELGQSYLMGLTKAQNENEQLEVLVDIWEQKILPQIQEYFYDRTDILAEILKIDEALSDDTLRDKYPYKYLEGYEMERQISRSTLWRLDSTNDIKDVLKVIVK